MQDTIGVHDAYVAMFAFLEELYSTYDFDQLGGLLGSMTLLPDGSPSAPAIWDDWLRAVEKAKTKPFDAG